MLDGKSVIGTIYSLHFAETFNVFDVCREYFAVSSTDESEHH